MIRLQTDSECVPVFGPIRSSDSLEMDHIAYNHIETPFSQFIFIMYPDTINVSNSSQDMRVFIFGYETHKFIVLYTCSDSQPDSITHMPSTYKYAWLLVRNPSLAKSLELWSVVRTLFERTNINSLGPQLIGTFERNSFLPYH